MDWQEAKDQLARLAAQDGFGLISDVDGTLSPIVDDPDKAYITTRNLELLAALSYELRLVALISGRAAADIHERVGLPNIVYVGNHGLERWVRGKALILPEAAAFRAALRKALIKLEVILESGVMLEDKGATLTVHYRNHPDPEAFADRFRGRFEALASEHNLVLGSGRKVFEFRPPIEVDKGSALRRLVEEARLRSALYIGDDTTDVAALRAARALRESGECEAWGVGVQSEETPEAVASTADFSASGVEGVEGLLDWLLRARRASST